MANQGADLEVVWEDDPTTEDHDPRGRDPSTGDGRHARFSDDVLPPTMSSGDRQPSQSILRTGRFRPTPSGSEHSRFNSRAKTPGKSVTYNHNVVFREIADEPTAQGDYVSVANRNVNLAYDVVRELEPTSAISTAGRVTTFPMARDNERFFNTSSGYGQLLGDVTRELEKQGKKGGGTSTWKEANSEVTFLGAIWRWFLAVFMAFTNDAINRLRFTRGLEDNLPFMAPYESFALGGVIRAYDVDRRSLDGYNVGLAFKNRNVGRVLVQNLARWDRVWHISTALVWNRVFDLIGQFPFIGFTSFAPSENFPASKDHSIQAILRPFFEGSFVTRFLTGNQQSLTTLEQKTAAQNLAAEATGFEVANRNQYGTYFGRMKTDKFRLEHRLPTDESIYRTFIASPASTTVNNGPEHVLRVLAKHWKNMLYQENGNFGHQRQELLHPFEILRFHMPILLVTLTNLRGRNKWDSRVLGPFVRSLQMFNPERVRKRTTEGDEEGGQDRDMFEIYGPCKAAQKYIREMQNRIVHEVCGGIPSRVRPFQEWLEAMYDSCDVLREEAQELSLFVKSVDPGIRLGYALLKAVNWRVPSDAALGRDIARHLKGQDTVSVPHECVYAVFNKLTSKDENTLKQLYAQNMQRSQPAKLLFGRVKTLLERELRRKALDERIVMLSRGQDVGSSALENGRWYWVKRGDSWRVSVFVKRSRDGQQVTLTDVENNLTEKIDEASTSFKAYVPVAEAISRAQKAFMTVELDHIKRFHYNAFLEFGSPENPRSLRTRLRRLVTLSQIHCGELDKARLNVLTEVKNYAGSGGLRSRYTNCRAQNACIIGGGPTGLLAAIHCTQNVLMSGGDVKLYEHRDAFYQHGATFERGQIVRLDSRQIAMVRYHLGTGFEDVFIPARGESGPHLGNVIPNQGFVEVTIKRMETMLLDEVIELRSKELLYYFSGSKIEHDDDTNSFKKSGSSLKPGDLVKLDDGKSWEVKDFIHQRALSDKDLAKGGSYDIVSPRDKTTHPYRLECKDENGWHHFTAQDKDAEDIVCATGRLPPVYEQGKGTIDPIEIVLENVDTSEMKNLSFSGAKKTVFDLDLTESHVLMAFGKPRASNVHYKATTEEPYAVCCIEGLKVSMGMHRFGEKRWGSGILDDIRSISDSNMRLVGDFTKSVELTAILEKIKTNLDDNSGVWAQHFRCLPESFNDKLPSFSADLQIAAAELAKTKCRRTRLQTRFFELGDNYYLGLELPREFDTWKTKFVENSVPDAPETARDDVRANRKKLRGTVMNHLDRLWFESCVHVIQSGDVYNPGAKNRIPQFYTIDNPLEQTLGQMDKFEAFSLTNRTYRVDRHEGNALTRIQNEGENVTFTVPSNTYVSTYGEGKKGGKTRLLSELDANDRFNCIDRFEVLSKHLGYSMVRTSLGSVLKMPHRVKVHRKSNLARAPDGFSESKVALASFPVAHYICHRTCVVNPQFRQEYGTDDGYIMAYVGDAQCSPHFMRYSGLTGAIISCMSFNNMVAQALDGVNFADRAQAFAFVTTWSNGEVVERGTGANYGQDGFVRPGSSYRTLIDYLYARAEEHQELGSDMDEIVSRDWKTKFASGIVPRGLENDGQFRAALLKELRRVICGKYEDEVRKSLGVKELPLDVQKAVEWRVARATVQWSTSAQERTSASSEEPRMKSSVKNFDMIDELVGSTIGALEQIIDHSYELRYHNLRVSSELFNQAKPVDSIVDDFAVEAQNFANSLTQSAAFATGAISLRLITTSGGNILSSILGILGIASTFGTMTNVSRYRNRNEEYRVFFYDDKYLNVKKGVFSLMTRDQRDEFELKDNPYVVELDAKVAFFNKQIEYYDMDPKLADSFNEAYQSLRGSLSDTREGRSKIPAFLRRLVEEFIPITFQKNPYLQEELVAMYKALYEKLELMRKDDAKAVGGTDKLFRMLLDFEVPLEKSLQRGEISYGFLRKRPWYEWSLFVSLRYIFAPLYPFRVTRRTERILNEIRKIQYANRKRRCLLRETRDMEEQYYATTESEISSMIYLTGLTGFLTNTFFTVVRFVSFALPDNETVATVVNAAAWAGIVSISAAILAFFHLVRKLRHLVKLDAALGSMAKKNKSVRKVRGVTRTQEALTVTRIGANMAACVALPWTLIEGQFDTNSGDIPVYIAAGAVLAAIGSVLFFFVVEYVVRYNLDPCLGQVVCDPFAKKLQALYRTFSDGVVNEAGIDPIDKLDREAWEYTAREFLSSRGYRFDTVFAADRFGSIMQYIQSGAHRAEPYQDKQNMPQDNGNNENGKASGRNVVEIDL